MGRRLGGIHQCLQRDTEDPTPHGENFMGKVNKGAISMLPNQSGLTGISTIIQSTKSDVSASLTDGLESSSSQIQTQTNGVEK